MGSQVEGLQWWGASGYKNPLIGSGDGEFLPRLQHPFWRDLPRMTRVRAEAALASISQMEKPVTTPGSLWHGLLLLGAPQMGKHAACAQPAAPEAGSGQPRGRTSCFPLQGLPR